MLIMFGFKKPIMPTSPTSPPPPPVLPPAPISSGYGIVEIPVKSIVPIEDSSYKTKYENILSELRLKFLLSVSDSIDEWISDPNNPPNSGFNNPFSITKTETFVFKDIFSIHYFAITGNSPQGQLTFRAQDHTLHEYEIQSLGIPNDCRDEFVLAYLKIANKLKHDKEEQYYADKLSDAQELLEKC